MKVALALEWLSNEYIFPKSEFLCFSDIWNFMVNLGGEEYIFRCGLVYLQHKLEDLLYETMSSNLL